MYKKIILLLLISLNAFSITEFDFNFGYEKSRFGADRQNKSVSRSYGGSIAFYFFNLTAIEFNYSQNEDETIVNNDTTNATNLVISSETSSLITKTYGVGLRQALAPKTSFLIPSVSLGWARQFFTDRSTATILNKTDSSKTIYDSGESKVSYDSVFAAFALKIRITQTMSLKGGVKTAFKAFEFSEAKNQVSYSAGLSWIF